MKNVRSLVIYINTKFEVNLNSLFTANQDLNSCPPPPQKRDILVAKSVYLSIG